jgi:hypothetical protein
VTGPREQFLDDVRRYIVVGDALAAGIAEFTAMQRGALDDLEHGMAITESFARRDSAGWSRRVAALLEAFEEVRRDTRTSAAAALMDEGRTVTDVGRAFGVSHQLASRFARAAPHDTPDVPPDEGNAPRP